MWPLNKNISLLFKEGGNVSITQSLPHKFKYKYQSLMGIQFSQKCWSTQESKKTIDRNILIPLKEVINMCVLH